MTQRTCCLLLSRVPYPPIGGDRLKSYNLIKILASQYKVTAVIISDEKLSQEAIDFFKKYKIDFYLFYKPSWRFRLNSLRALVTSNPLQVEYYYFPSIVPDVTRILGMCDFVIVNLVRLAPYIVDVDKPVYLDIVDSIGLNYLTSRKNVKSIFWRAIYKFEISRLLEFEKRCVERFTNTFFVNKYECKYFGKYGSTQWIPNGVSPDVLFYNKKSSCYDATVAFFGKMDYQPNVDAVLWFVNSVLYKLPNVSFYIVGSNPTGQIKKLAVKYKNVHVTGYVKDPYLILNSCCLIVSPMQTGGGIQNKILEAMALGQINVLTTKAATPIIGAEKNKHFLLANTPTEMVDKIVAVLSHRSDFEEIGKNARNLISHRYLWDNYKSDLIRMIDKDIHKRTQI